MEREVNNTHFANSALLKGTIRMSRKTERRPNRVSSQNSLSIQPHSTENVSTLFKDKWKNILTCFKQSISWVRLFWLIKPIFAELILVTSALCFSDLILSLTLIFDFTKEVYQGKKKPKPTDSIEVQSFFYMFVFSCSGSSLLTVKVDQ